ncbi:MAG: amidohydrolase [Bryobacterales bacterium]|nr:amidohydrolase [Bryobacterales bacterium]MBV9401135.1 amidohydrolase [Bryobacterales bacterium]
MKIDLFNHFFPKRFFEKFIDTGGIRDIGKRVRNIQAIHDLDFRLKVADEFGEGYTQFLTLPAPPIEALGSPSESPEAAKIGNDGLAELCQKHPERFIGFGAAMPMNNIDACLKEMERAVTQLGARGIQIYTNVQGKPLDDPEFFPLFEEAARRDIAILMHPTRGADFPDYKTEEKSLYEIWWTLGWPYETSVAMSRIVFSGILEKLPNLKVVTHHLGGMVPYFEGRVGHGWDQLGSRTSDVDYKALLKSMKKRPIDYLKMFYGDTALFGARAGTICGLEFFGVDHVLFASDTPFEPTPGLFIRETIKVIDSLEIDTADRNKIYFGNAQRLLKLAKPVGQA